MEREFDHIRQEKEIEDENNPKMYMKQSMKDKKEDINQRRIAFENFRNAKREQERELKTDHEDNDEDLIGIISDPAPDKLDDHLDSNRIDDIVMDKKNFKL